MRILVVDDEPDIANFVARVLQARGCACTVLHTAREAFELLASETFEFVLCDLQMPSMSGIELYDALVAAGNPAAARIAFLTGSANSPAHQDFFRRSGRPYLEKPFDVQRLKAFVDELAATQAGPTPLPVP
ncbi:MAG: response regulator [Candidatus Wallbacteria bacterium]|nr:response regulator [Candidatus Wallbacteria bacterium]